MSNLNRLESRKNGHTKSVEILKHLLAIALEDHLNQSIKHISAVAREYPPTPTANFPPPYLLYSIVAMYQPYTSQSVCALAGAREICA